jgi:hypothetical protein
MRNWAPIAGLTLVYALVSSGLTGCGYIAHGSLQRVPIISEPHGAQVTIDGKLYPETPITAALDRKGQHMVEISKAGYESQTMDLHRQIDRESLWGDIALIFAAYSGLIFLPVDAVTGGLYELHLDQISVQLLETPQPGGAAADAAAE